MMRNAVVTVATMALTVVVIGNAYVQKKQFYPSVVYITKSNPSMAVIYLQALIIIWLMGKLMQKLFFGDLRAAEIEHLIERFWYAITETCLAFTVFKDDFSPKFIALFALLLFLKTFHWLAEDRVDYMERSPVISWLFHTRVVFLLNLLGLVDLYFISFAYHHTITKGASVQLVFGFEYAILLTVVVNTTIKYILHVIDMNREVFWENKAVFLLHIEVFIGFIKVALYICFVMLMIKLYTLPLFAFRPMYYSMRNFKKALNDVIQSRRAIRNMNTLYPDATAEELVAADNVCIICREEMQAGAKKLPCNHIFHVSCLRSWFQRHQTCPTCRLNVLRTPEPQPTPAAAAPPPQMPPQNMGIPPMFAFPAWQPPFMPPMPNANLQQPPNIPNAGDTRPPQPPSQPQQPSQATPPGPIPQPQPFTAESGRGSSGVTPNENPFMRQFPLPFLFPPIPPFFPGMAPPPMPPPNWSGLSLEELRQMEDAERRGVEARLQCLRNIHTFIDASVLLMQQYLASAAVAAAASATTANAASRSADSHATQSPESSSTSNIPTTSKSEPSTSQSNLFSQQSSESSTTPDSSSATSDNSSKGSVAADKLDDKATVEHDNFSGIENSADSESQESDEIRKRRLEKFANSSS